MEIGEAVRVVGDFRRRARLVQEGGCLEIGGRGGFRRRDAISEEGTACGGGGVFSEKGWLSEEKVVF